VTAQVLTKGQSDGPDPLLQLQTIPRRRQKACDKLFAPERTIKRGGTCRQGFNEGAIKLVFERLRQEQIAYRAVRTRGSASAPVLPSSST
jgi:hypothetical protein